ncbi:WD40 repeat-like protein [Pyrenochaeta sp. DS3sAY3a]|nr:WD40 repeat-like protein [Pyrenochaeta sp. DS3sAY3a]
MDHLVPTFLPQVQHQDNAHSKRIYTIQATTNLIVSGSADGSIRVWSKRQAALTLPPLISPNQQASILAVAVSEELDIVLGGNSLGNITIWRLSNGVLLHTQGCHKEAVLAISLDKSTVVTTSRDQTALVWDLETEPCGMHLRHTLRGHSMAVLSARLSEQYIYTSSGDKTFRLWDRDSGSLVRDVAQNASANQFQLIESTIVLCACTDNTVRLSNIESGTDLACLQGHTNVVRAVEVIEKADSRADSKSSIDYLQVASASYDGTIRIWAIHHKESIPWTCLRILSFSDMVLTPLPSLSRHAMETSLATGTVEVHRVMDMALDGRFLYCCGEAAEIVCWHLPE